jgi:TRAP-type mannitol/chloroaromatic compound transport system permease small subunit
VRKALNFSSNAFLEIQWYLFAAIFLVAAGYTLMRQEHVKIDVISGRFSKRTQIWIDIVGITCFLLPFVVQVIRLSLPLVIRAYDSHEMSSNAGGLIRWPVFAMLPLGMAFLGLQGVSELIKRIAFLRGLVPDPTRKHQAKSAEEELAEALAKEVAAREQAALRAKQ